MIDFYRWFIESGKYMPINDEQGVKCNFSGTPRDQLKREQLEDQQWENIDAVYSHIECGNALECEIEEMLSEQDLQLLDASGIEIKGQSFRGVCVCCHCETPLYVAPSEYDPECNYCGENPRCRP